VNDLIPPGRADDFTSGRIGGAEFVARHALAGAGLLRDLAEAASLRGMAGVEVLREGVNVLAAVSLPRVEGLLQKGFLKAFGPRGWRSGWRPPRAVRAARTAFEMLARGLPTPEPLALVLPAGPPWREGILVVEFVEGRELREYLAALREGRALPGGVSPGDFLEALGRFVRRVHDAGVFHGDLGGGNILVTSGAGEGQGGRGLSFTLVDVTRAAVGRAVGRLARLRDLARIKIPAALRGPLVDAYSEPEPGIPNLRLQDRVVFALYRTKVAAKRLLARLASAFRLT
jgi:hypothetical protein